MARVSDARMVRHLMEAKGVNQTEVAQATGIANSTISAVLKGVRQLTREHVGQLAIFFHVDPGVFIFGEQQRPRKPNAQGGGFFVAFRLPYLDNQASSKRISFVVEISLPWHCYLKSC